jgi:hypothetical protein
LSENNILESGFSQAYIQTFQPAAVATSYGHFLNAAIGSCVSQPAVTSPLACAPGGDQMTSQNNVLGIHVAAGTEVVGNYSEKVTQVAMHDQTATSKQLVRDHARILPLGKIYCITMPK